MTQRSTTRFGFTLVEVLVTVTILGVLTAILLPAMSQARGVAQSAKCQSNLRQWGFALSCYVSNNNDYIPRRGQGIQPVTLIDRPEDWFNCLPGYLGERPLVNLVSSGHPPRPGADSIFICPAASDPGGLYFLPYAMNMYLSPWIRPDPHLLTEIPQPDRLVFMADAPGPYSATVPSKHPYSVAARHLGKANLVFVDGHVESRDGDYLGCGVGDPAHRDVCWQTGTGGVNQPPVD